MADIQPRVSVGPGAFHNHFFIRWLKRKTKFYNRKGDCRQCGRVVSRHQQLCPACLAIIHSQGEDDEDDRKTIESIRADWHI
jgi:predicted amidophosphoribosyltransferase